MSVKTRSSGFTLIELLIVVAIIALLISILLPGLNAARQQARATKCLSQLRVLGQGLVMYSTEHGDVLVPGRLPNVDSCNWAASIAGGRKYRPTFMAMMSRSVGTPPFADPQACGNTNDRFGQAGNKQNYSDPIYVCPSVPDRTDERNGSYGYNYQFLGNSRLDTQNRFKHWPVIITRLRHPGDTVAIADCMGTAASYRPSERDSYIDDSSDEFRFGNEGFNLDPPRVDPINGEMANIANQHRTAVEDRHRGRGSVLWVDAHADARTLPQLGYKFDTEGRINFDGENNLWSGRREDVPWLPDFRH